MTDHDRETAGTPRAAFDATSLRHARHDANITQAELADRLGVRLRTVEQWEWGTRAIPPELAEQLTAALGQQAAPNEATDSPAGEATRASPRPQPAQPSLSELSAKTAQLEADVASSSRRIRELEVERDRAQRRASAQALPDALLRDTLVTAQKAARDVREDARRTASDALRKARKRARRATEETDRLAELARERAHRTVAEAEEIRGRIEAELERLTRAARREAERMLREAERERRLIKDEIIELEREAAAKRGEIRSLLLALLAREDEPAAADERSLAEVIFEHEMSRRPEPSDEAPD